jgi:ubiquinone/menaquinone biosynthesis C-methylase UbiE
MTLTDPNAVFWDIHSSLPREGPGNRESTARALGLCVPIPPNSQVLDIACGPGQQTLDLAELLPDATICAVDRHEPFVEETNRRAVARGVADRVKANSGDMRSLAFPRAMFDLIWCEGAAYMMGVEKALRSWQPLLKPGGKLALSEAVWLRSDPPEEVRRIWSIDYPNMGTVETCRALVRDCGYRLLGDFVLPEAAWWEYYEPMRQRLELLASKYAGDRAAEPILRESAEEIAAYRKYSHYYGYVFLVMTASDGAPPSGSA